LVFLGRRSHFSIFLPFDLIKEVRSFAFYRCDRCLSSPFLCHSSFAFFPFSYHGLASSYRWLAFSFIPLSPSTLDFHLLGLSALRGWRIFYSPGPVPPAPSFLMDFFLPFYSPPQNAILSPLLCHLSGDGLFWPTLRQHPFFFRLGQPLPPRILFPPPPP